MQMIINYSPLPLILIYNISYCILIYLIIFIFVNFFYPFKNIDFWMISDSKKVPKIIIFIIFHHQLGIFRFFLFINNEVLYHSLNNKLFINIQKLLLNIIKFYQKTIFISLIYIYNAFLYLLIIIYFIFLIQYIIN